MLQVCARLRSVQGRSQSFLLGIFDEKSIKTGWMTYDVVNYRTLSTPFLLRSSHGKKSSKNVERESTVLTNIENERVNLESLIGHVRDEYNVERHAIQYTFNSNNVVFVQTVNGDFYSMGLSHEGYGEPRVTFTKTYKGVENRILSASPTRVGLVIETESRVLLFAKGAWITIVDSEVLAVRTFARSRRYQNLVAITKEDGLLLTGFFDETTLSRRSDRR